MGLEREALYERKAVVGNSCSVDTLGCPHDGRSRLKPRHKEELGTLRHPKTTLTMGVLCSVFFAALTVLSGLSADWWVTAFFAGFAAMSTSMILDYFMARHRVTEDGMAYRKLLGKTGFLRWSDLKKVRYGPR